MKYLKSYKLFESLVSNFPDELDIKDIFLELIDDNIISKIEFSYSGYIYFPYLPIRGQLRSELYSDMSEYPENWELRKPEELMDDNWSNLFLDLSDSRNNYMLYKSSHCLNIEEVEQSIKLSKLNKLESKPFNQLFLENIENGKIKAYPVIRFNIGYFHENDFEKVIESLERVYDATGFRPIDEIWDEDYVNEETGDLVKLYGANLQLVKVTDIEYKNLTSVYSRRELEKKLIKHFI